MYSGGPNTPPCTGSGSSSSCTSTLAVPKSSTLSKSEHSSRAVELDRAFLLDQILERLALEELHHEVHRPLRQDAEVGDVDDVRVVDRGRRARLAEEPMDRLLIARELRVQDLHRHRLLDVDVLAEIHRPHAAAAEDLVEPVVADVVAEPGDVFLFHEHGRVVQAEPFPVGEPRETAW